MKRPAPLSSAARELLALGSHVDPPTFEQDARMDRAVSHLIALERAAPPASAASLSRQRGARGLLERGGLVPPLAGRRLAQVLATGTGKLVLALGALAATASASFWIGRVSAPVSTPDSAHTEAAPESTPASIPVALPLGSPAATVTLPAPPSRVDRQDDARMSASAPTSEMATSGVATSSPVVTRPMPDRRHALAPPATTAARGLAAEVERLARAEAALRQGRPRQALAELAQPAEHLLEQAAALRAIAECEIEAGSGAADARAVLQRWPRSAFAPRVRAACGS